jgi:hypothetical protein
MNTVVISQPMFFPWIGIFEQIRLSDIYVHYDDVQLPQGRSFINRVQIKTKDGIKWLTVPLKRSSSIQLIQDSFISYEENWIDKHLKFLSINYLRSPFKDDMISIAETTYKHKFETISQLNIYAIEAICKYFNFYKAKEFHISSQLNLTTTSSQHLLDIVRIFNGQYYVTGLGALNYLDYEIFEKEKVRVNYMVYNKNPYFQLYGEFTPYVSILDLIANEGIGGVDVINSESMYWKEFIN